MKPLAAAFALLLVFAHLHGDPTRLAMPLSLFRDADPPALGYALFALLAAVGAWYAGTLARCRRYGDLAVTGAAVALLVAVAATPSLGEAHFIYSVLLLGLLFLYFAWLLFRDGSFWLFAHLAAPSMLVAASRAHSYGAWQKGLILYFVRAVAVHHHQLTRTYAAAPSPGKRRTTAVRVNLQPRRRP